MEAPAEACGAATAQAEHGWKEDRVSDSTDDILPANGDQPRSSRSAAIKFMPGPAAERQIHDLIDRIKESADKLATDGSSRGDLKILSRALRELRYASKSFLPIGLREKSPSSVPRGPRNMIPPISRR
jgi:hypothetical protein